MECEGQGFFSEQYSAKGQKSLPGAFLTDGRQVYVAAGQQHAPFEYIF